MTATPETEIQRINPNRTPRGSSWRAFRISILIIVAVVLACAAVLSKRSPTWFEQQMTIDAAMEGRSADFEQALAAQFTKVRGSDSQWALCIREQDMNEWLASRLPRWLEHQGASALECNRATRLRCLEDRLEIARENAWSVGVVALAPRAQSSTGTNANGTNIHGTNTHEVLAPTGASLGSLIIPTTLVRTFGPAELMHSLNKREFPLADGRRVRVMDLEVLPGEIRLALATEPAKK